MVDNKKLFPGVTQEQLDAEDRKKQKQKAREVETTAKQQQEAERKRLLEKFGIDLDKYAQEMRKAVRGSVFGGLMGWAFWFCLSFMVNGFIDTFQGKEVDGVEWTKSVVNPFVDGKFAPTSAWYRQLAFLVVSVLIAIKISKVYGEDRHEHSQVVDAVDMMLDLEDLGTKYNLNKRQVKRLVEVVPHIIENMSAEKRVYFDMLMNGEISIKDNKTFRDMAVAIMEGHLHSHPEDAALILEAFDERSLPDALLRRCKSLQKGS